MLYMEGESPSTYNGEMKKVWLHHTKRYGPPCYSAAWWSMAHNYYFLSL